MFRGLAVRYRSWIFVFLLLIGVSQAFAQGTRPAKGGEDVGEVDRPQERERYFRRGRTLKGESGAALRYRAYKDKLKRRAERAAATAASSQTSSQPPRPPLP